MVVAFPRDLVFEAYLGQWVDVTALAIGRSLRQVEPVTVNWGLPNEQAKALAPPSTAEGVLNNLGGHWTPGNPMSDYYAYLQARNAPTRLALRVSRDSFTGRTNASSWLTSDTGDNWTAATSGSGSVSVGSGVGTHSQPNAGAWVMTTLGDSYGDAHVRSTCGVLPFVNVTGAPVEPNNLVLRYQASGPFAGEHYLLRLEIRTDQSVWISIYHSTLGALNTPVSLTSLIGLAHAGNNQIRAAFQIEGQTLRGKAWDAANPEPLGWQTVAHHERLTGGFVGVRSGVAVGNTNTKPIDFTYDDWELRLVRHTGELAKLQPTWDETHRIKKAAFKCADVTQRLGRPNRPSLSSAPRRYLASNLEFTTTDFWPLDESATAPLQGLSATGGERAQFVRAAGPQGSITWGVADPSFASVPAFPVLSTAGSLWFTPSPNTLPSSMSVMFAMRSSPDDENELRIDVPGQDSFFEVIFRRSGIYELYGSNPFTLLTTGTYMPAGQAGYWVTFGLTLFNNGGSNVGYHLNVNGETLGVGNWTGGPYAAPSRIRVYAGTGLNQVSQAGSAFSSVFLTAARFDTIIGGTSTSYGTRASNVLRGWIGERALARAYRLCFEEGVPFDYWGDFGTTPPMGPQRPIPLLDQLVECAEADQGFLYGPRYTAGVAFRSRRSMVARSPVATLSYSSGHVAKELAPAADDRPSANLVRAERLNGGFVIIEQVTGPMNTKDPGTDPDAIGDSPGKATVNVESDASLPNIGGWVRALGTTPDVRYPKVTVDLAARELTTGVDPTLPARQVLQLNVGDRLLVQGLTAADIYRDLDQLVRGGTDVFTNVRLHKVTLNTAPYEKYRGFAWGDGAGRWDTVLTTLVAQLNAGVTGVVSVNVTGPLWNTAAGNYPLDLVINGEVITISAASGASSPQTLTISARGVNGANKTHPAGSKLTLATRYYWQ